MLNAKSLIAMAVLTAGVAVAAHAQSYVNVTVGAPFVPGVYGQVSFGNGAPPPVMDIHPVVVGRPAYGAVPIYLHVALHEYRDWGRYCRKYGACEQPVHFVLIDQNNRWWERGVGRYPHHHHHQQYPNHYSQNDNGHWDNGRGDSRRDNRRDSRGDRDYQRHYQENYWDPRFESKRGER